jgi:hypothetical protein
MKAIEGLRPSFRPRLPGPCLRLSTREGESRAASTITLPYCLTAIAEISIFAPPINPATWTVALAALGSGMSAL